MLSKLLTTKPADRDEKWVDDFLEALADSDVSLISPDPQQGPDGFPYLMVSTKELNEEKEIRLQADQQLFTGKPSEAYWPDVARKTFKEFLVQQGILQPRVILLSEEEGGPMDLAFSLESLSNPPEAEWDGVLEAFSWFFPRHYSLALLSEKSIAGAQFEPV